MRKAGALDQADELKVATVLFSADQLDRLDPLASPAMTASLLRAHLAASKALFDQEQSTTDDDSVMSEFLAILGDVRGDAVTEPGFRTGEVPPWMR
jgi:hypothetical protein